MGEALLDISTRAQAETGDNSLIGGFILGNGTATKTIAVRALGPSLGGLGVSSPLLNPSLQLFNSSGQIIGSNDDWMTNPNMQEIIDAGLAPSDSRESVILTTLGPGSYTAVVTGVDSDTNDVALVEVFDLDSLNTPQLLNISTRGLAGTSDRVMIAGVIVGGATAKAIVVRGLGPSLASSVANPLPNPTLTIVNSLGTIVATNDDWQLDPGASEISALGLAPASALESATLLTLLPGSYTAILSDATGNTGIGLVEVYSVTNSQ